MLKELETAEDFFNEIANGLVMVDMSTQWCSPCRMLAKILPELAEKVKDNANILTVDTDEFPEIRKTYGVLSIPTLIFFQNGVEVKRIVGAKTLAELEVEINQLSNPQRG